MFDKNSPFFIRSKNIVEEFLQTTVIVDDQAYSESEILKREPTPPKPADDLVAPGRKARAASLKEPAAILDVSAPPMLENGSHFLDAQKVINSFAERRIVCSVIKPSANDEKAWINSVEKLASSADIIILDWEINKDGGENALNIFSKILKSSNEIPAQLRLLAIYTGSPGIVDIVKEIKTKIKRTLKIDDTKIQEQDDGFALMVGSVRIVIFSKADTYGLLPAYENRKVKFEDLADRVIIEFTVMTAGLISNVVLKSLTLIRKNTRKILGKFSIHLDAPYLTHRALLVNTNDAEELLTELIAEELRAILDEGNVGNEANPNSIKEWLSTNNNAGFVLALKKSINFTLDQIDDLLRTGIGKWGGISNNQKEKPHRHPFTEMFRPKALTTAFLDEKFGLLTTVRSTYEKKIPKLTFGTIVQNLKDSNYWVCIQPRCDSVRIESIRAFPFLPLILAGVDTKFQLVLESGASHIRLTLKDKPHNLGLISFEPGPNEDVINAIYKKSIGYHFISSKKEKFRWVGELRPQHAQRIANEFASNLSRVGLDESEWLRLWGTKG